MMSNQDDKVPTMLGNEGPEWLVISGPRYRVSGAQTWVEQIRARKEECKDAVGQTPMETCRLREAMPPSEVARRYNVRREEVAGLETEGQLISIFTWLRLFGFYGPDLGVQYIDEGGNQIERSYITLLNVNIRRYKGDIESASRQTRKHFFKELRKGHIKREGTCRE